MADEMEINEFLRSEKETNLARQNESKRMRAIEGMSDENEPWNCPIQYYIFHRWKQVSLEDLTAECETPEKAW